MAKQTLNIKNHRHSGYYRAGIRFKRGENLLQLAELSQAQLATIKADPVLELLKSTEDTAETDPDSHSATQGAVDALSLDSPLATTSQEPISCLAEAFALLDPANLDHFTKGGKPQIDALEKLLGRKVAADERDAAWDTYQAEQELA
ncbi:HI1506-related protein [Agarivorans gilvus]|uniref:Mu-like prophage FluMu N-terminal domain-containing protein n=1 Tax=Agarivorans gilvus TaxID=680279 RepID=A0ABQ1HZX1_9ALTE|nr:HI1506-related protein [Agarivorans gilvus]GGA95789.1 hypothetical protein GCM10007414_05770 [Agarivorans gilvus]